MIAIAGPGEEANAVIDRWSAAYSSNDLDAVVKSYRPDAILFGTFSPAISQGTDAIRAYYSDIKGSGAKNSIGERYTMVLNDNAVVVTGFYDFTRLKDRSGGIRTFHALLCFSSNMTANGSLLITIPHHEGNQLTESFRFLHQIREFSPASLLAASL